MKPERSECFTTLRSLSGGPTSHRLGRDPWAPAHIAPKSHVMCALDLHQEDDN